MMILLSRITANPDINDDLTVQDTWHRIAEACANPRFSYEIYQEDYDDFLSILRDFNFLPAGRIIAGAGSGRNVTLFNCYVMGTVPDDISGIFKMLQEAALTMQQGGGIGYDFSPLRPMGSPVKGVDADASGPLSFMNVWDAMCKTIMSAGYRRGAMMATMRCDHPDIEAFITAKQDSAKLRMFNMSVLCSDAFMHAVKENRKWDLVHESSPPVGQEKVIFGQSADAKPLYIHKTIQARDLWELIMKSTYNYAEPGVIFIDEINQKNNLWYMEDIAATNPCGEQPLPPYGACLLGSINLTKMVVDPFGAPSINYDKIRQTARIAVRMLDRVIDMSLFPIPQQKMEALKKRRMGIGITGLADMLFMMGLTYGTPEAAKLAEKVMKEITIACYEESIGLASKYGPCPATASPQQRSDFIRSGFMMNMPEHIHRGILKHGIRNALLTSIAPTGTISMYAGNVSSGIEPIFATEYTRKVLENDGITKREEVVQDYAVHLLSRHTDENRKTAMECLVTAQTLTPQDHLVMQAAVQPWVDSSISKTINCPEDISYEDFEAIYMEAYDQGCKGCTTYRPNDVTGSVLSVESSDKPKGTTVTDREALVLKRPISEPIPRPKNLTGTTYKLKWDDKNFYVTINDYVDEDGDTIPFELFINSAEMANLQWTVALTRMISAIFRRGGNVSFIGKELKRISDPAGGFWSEQKYVPSFVALLGQTIEKHMSGVTDNAVLVETMGTPTPQLTGGTPLQCGECCEYAVIVSGGCATCTTCGHSKCG
jgi:ribonucleoside-diphosphate reductase alpha chain